MLTGGKGPNEDTIQNQIRKNKTMNDNKIITTEDGDEYTEEYSAPGYDENGNPVEIFMTFTQVKGEEIDPENLNWFQDSDRVEAL